LDKCQIEGHYSKECLILKRLYHDLTIGLETLNSQECQNSETMLKDLLNKASNFGVSYADIRFQRQDSEMIVVDNKTLKSYSSDRLSGIGIRVVFGGGLGYASTSDLTANSMKKTLRTAIKAAALVRGKQKLLAPVNVCESKNIAEMKIDPFEVSAEEKVSLVLDANKAAWVDNQVKNASTIYASTKETKLFMSTEGAKVQVEATLVGLGHMSVVQIEGVMENISSSESECAGFEFIQSMDWGSFSKDVSKLAIEAAGSKTAKSGTYPVVVHPEVFGVVLHEAFGHAAEGDFVAAGASVLQNKQGSQIASDQVTVADEGVIEGGYYCPFDDEGVKKMKTTVVENGFLKDYLLDRRSACQLGKESTGNGRAQDFQNLPIVRQTNLYLESGDYELDELIEDVDYGIFVMAKGLKGGEVNPGLGTFTFGVGPSRIIEKGELTEMARGVVVSGSILDTLKTIDAVGKKVKIITSAFGGCGKNSQRAWVGLGGPHVRVREMTVGGN
jgi:TldD protein